MTRVPNLRLVALIGLLLLMLALAACARAPAPLAQLQGEKVTERAAVPTAPPPAPLGFSPDLAYPGLGSGGAVPEARSQARQGVFDSRQVIRTADLTIVVDDTQTAVNQLRAMAGSFGGYMADAKLWQVKDDLMRGTITLRIDAREFDDALDRIKELALEVQRENIGSQDVTQEYTDLKSRLRNLEATEKELLALLSDIRKQTHNAEDILRVYRQLTEIRGQIEQIKGRMQYLNNQISLATINVELIPKEEKPIVQPGWQPAQTLRDALGALASAGQWFVNAAIWLVVFVLPVGLVIATPVGLMVAGFRRWRGRPVAEST